VPGDEKADEWAKPAADEPTLKAWNSSDAGTGTGEAASPGPLAHLKRSITETKWKEAKA
jgi:hypothetical protein